MRPIVIAAGGTGGHFSPAEALAAELIARGQRVVLMTDRRAAARGLGVFDGHETYVIAGGGIAGRGGTRAARAVASLAVGLAQARRVLGRMEPAAVVGFGGYPSLAPVLAARSLRPRPVIVLHEQNAVLGRANRFLGGRADVLALSFPDTVCASHPTTVVTGNPVRGAITPTAYATDETFRVLVLGGSLGARVFSDVLPPALASLPEASRARLSVVQQCRREDVERVRAAYAAASVTAELSTHFADVPARLAAANLLIARAGASTVAELAAAGRPSLLVPLPNAIDDHQAANAAALAGAGAAWVMPQAGLTSVALAHRLATLIDDPATLATAASAALAFARPNAAEHLADLVVARVQEKTR